MLPTPEPRPSRRRLAPWVLAIMVVVLVAAGLVALAAHEDDSGGGEVGSGRAPSTQSADRDGQSDQVDGSERSTSSTTTTPSVGPNVPPAQRRVFDELMAQVAEIRGLAWKQPLDLRVVSRPEMVRKLREVNERDTDPALLAAEADTLKLLGLIPADLNYAAFLDELFAVVVLGFYDPLTRELYVAGGELDGPTKATIVHEMTHALTDQHFGYGPKLLELDEADRAEEAAAYSALVEGDAVAVETIWSERNLDELEALARILGGDIDEGASDVLGRMPEYLNQALYFPYTEGLSFVDGLHDAGGFAAVDAAYRRPPTSTEHILHPSTYAEGQAWTPPPLPDVAAAAGCSRVRSGALGQFDMQQVLDQHISVSDATRAVEGWNGDSYAVVRCGGTLGMADRWETDGGADAGRLADALGRWARSWSGGRAPGADGRFSGPAGAGRITGNGGRVDLVIARDAPTADRLARALG
jgi:hypothetical protein